MSECTVIRGGRPFEGRQGLSYFEGISAQSAGAQALCMHLLEMPPGAEALPHLHEAHETGILALSGRAKMRYGEGLSQELEVGTPATSSTSRPGCRTSRSTAGDETCKAVIARTDPNEQESVVLLDEQGRRRP